MQNLHIRNIADSDHYEIEWLTKRAFWNVNMPGCDEHYFSGKYYEPAMYEGDIHDPEYMKKVDEFDKQFPYMEKLVLPTQWR